jgi:cholesterol transport system auxiliary component
VKTALLVWMVPLAGCALLGKSEPVVPRYFTPEYEGSAAAPAPRGDLQLRLGRIEASSHLSERMAARRADREIVYREGRRWTERPEIYLRRALSRAIFEDRGVVESLSGRSVTLDVDLIAFEEIEQPHQARMQAQLTLRDDRIGLLEETITVDQPVTAQGDPAAAVVEALSRALHAGVTRIADRVVSKLVTQAPRTAKQALR